MRGDRESVRPRDRPLRAQRQGTKAADPLLEQGRQKDTLRPFGVPRPVGALLYLLFGSLLLIPLVRRMRRRASWVRWRLALGLLGLGGTALSWLRFESLLGVIAGALSLLLALALGRLRDPDAERILQRRHRADYLLNGGLHQGETFYLLIRGEHLLLVPRKEEEVQSAIRIERIARILVDGEPYVPVYVSEAKDPPTRAAEPIVDQTSVLLLELDDGRTLEFEYAGAFARHLADTAAHGVYSVRERLRRPEITRVSA